MASSGVIVTGTSEGGNFYMETVTYPNGTSYKVFMSSSFGKRWYKGAMCESYSAYLDDDEVFIYRFPKGAWVADTDVPDWYE